MTADDDALPRRDRGSTSAASAVAALPPAAPELEAADDEDQDQDRVRRDRRSEPDESRRARRAQSAGWSAATARPPSSGTIGSRLKRLRKKPVNASAIKKSRVERLAEPPERQRAEAADDRPRERDLRLAPDVVRQLLHRDQRAEERDEQRRATSGCPGAAPRARGPSRARTAARRSRPRTASPRAARTRRSRRASSPRAVKILNLKIASDADLNFQSSEPTNASGAQSFLRSERRGGSGWIGS